MKQKPKKEREDNQLGHSLYNKPNDLIDYFQKDKLISEIREQRSLIDFEKYSSTHQNIINNSTFLKKESLLYNQNINHDLLYSIWNEENQIEENKGSINNDNSYNKFTDPQGNYINLPYDKDMKILWKRPEEYIKEDNLNKELTQCGVLDNESRLVIKEKLKMILKKNSQYKKEENEDTINKNTMNLKRDSVLLVNNKISLIKTSLVKLKESKNIITDRYKKNDKTENITDFKKIEDLYSNYLEAYNKKSNFKICNFYFREENDDEYISRVNAMVNVNMNGNNKNNKKEKEIVNEGKEFEPKRNMIRQYSPSILNINLQLSIFSLWMSSILQIIIDNSIFDVYDGREIYKKIYPQVNNILNYSSSGCYYVRLYHKGTIVKVIIDDTMPIDSNTGNFILPQCNSLEEMWPYLITKSILKLYSHRIISINNGLDTLENFLSDTSVIYSLTGYLGEKILLKGNVFTLENSFSQKNYNQKNLFDSDAIRKREITKKHLILMNNNEKKENKEAQKEDASDDLIFKLTGEKWNGKGKVRNNSNEEIRFEKDKFSKLKTNVKLHFESGFEGEKLIKSNLKSLKTSVNIKNYKEIFNEMIINKENGNEVQDKKGKEEKSQTVVKTIPCHFLFYLSDYTTNEGFNINRLFPLEYDDLKSQFSQFRTSRNYKILSLKEKKLFFEEIEKLKHNLIEIKNKKVNGYLSNSSDLNMVFYKIRLDFYDFSSFKLKNFEEEDIDMLCQCIYHNWIVPPIDYIIEKYDKHIKKIRSEKENKLKQNEKNNQVDEEYNNLKTGNIMNTNNLKNNYKKLTMASIKKTRKETKIDQHKEKNQKNEEWRKYYFQVLGIKSEMSKEYIDYFNQDQLVYKNKKGIWLYKEDLPFNAMLILHNPLSYIGKLNLYLNNSHFNQEEYIIELKNERSSKLNSKLYMNRPSLIIYYEAKEKSNEYNNYILLDIQNSKGVMIYKDVILRKSFIIQQFDEFDNDEDYVIIIKGGIFPDGFYISIFCDFLISHIPKYEYMMKYTKTSYVKSSLLVKHYPLIPNDPCPFIRIKIEKSKGKESLLNPIEPNNVIYFFLINRSIKSNETIKNLTYFVNNKQLSSNMIQLDSFDNEIIYFTAICYVDNEIIENLEEVEFIFLFNKDFSYTITFSPIGFTIPFQIDDDCIKKSEKGILINEYLYVKSNSNINLSLYIKFLNGNEDEDELNDEIEFYLKISNEAEEEIFNKTFINKLYIFDLNINTYNKDYNNDYDFNDMSIKKHKSSMINIHSPINKTKPEKEQIKKYYLQIYSNQTIIDLYKKKNVLSNLHFKIKVFTSESLLFIKNNEKDQFEYKLIKNWEEAKPGRSSLSNKKRKLFLINKKIHEKKELFVNEKEFIEKLRFEKLPLVLGGESVRKDSKDNKDNRNIYIKDYNEILNYKEKSDVSKYIQSVSLDRNNAVNKLNYENSFDVFKHYYINKIDKEKEVKREIACNQSISDFYKHTIKKNKTKQSFFNLKINRLILPSEYEDERKKIRNDMFISHKTYNHKLLYTQNDINSCEDEVQKDVDKYISPFTIVNKEKLISTMKKFTMTRSFNVSNMKNSVYDEREKLKKRNQKEIREFNMTE